MHVGRTPAFRIGDWIVQPELNLLARNGVERHIEPKVMKVLLTLASQHNRVIPKEKLIAAAWPDTFVSDDVLTRCISILRRITEDDPHTPRFIQTIPKVGYRLVAEVAELPPQEDAQTVSPTYLRPASDIVVSDISTSAPTAIILKRPKPAFGIVLAAALLLGALIAGGFYLKTRNAGPISAFRTIQFTSYAGEQTQPAFSPDGSRIAFVWIAENGASRRIYIKTIGSEEINQLTTDTDEQFSPIWSPDGRQIAYLAKSKDSLGLSIADVASKIPPRKLLIPGAEPLGTGGFVLGAFR